MSRVESYRHTAAKQTVFDWFTNCIREQQDGLRNVYCDGIQLSDSFGSAQICVEHPFFLEHKPVFYNGEAFDGFSPWGDAKAEWRDRSPTIEELVALGRWPKFICDIVVFLSGVPVYAIEIIHAAPVSYEKRHWLNRNGITVIEMPARRVLGQVRRPEKLPIFRQSDAWKAAPPRPVVDWPPISILDDRPPAVRRLYSALVGFVQSNGLRPHIFAVDYATLAQKLEIRSKSRAYRIVVAAEKAGIIVRHDRGTGHSRGAKGLATIFGLVGIGETSASVLEAGGHDLKVIVRRRQLADTRR